MLVSGASRYSAYGASSQQVLASSYSDNTSLLTLGSSSSSSSLFSSDSDSTDSSSLLFGSASASSLFGSSGNPFGDTSSLFSSAPSTDDSVTEINALRARLTSTQTSMTNLDSVTPEGLATKSANYIAEEKAASSSSSDLSAVSPDTGGLGSLVDKTA